MTIFAAAVHGAPGLARATGATFDPGYSSFAGGREAVAVGDFDADGDHDVAAGTGGPVAGGGGLFVYENDGSYPAGFSSQALASGVTSVHAADLTGTAADEIVANTSGVSLFSRSGATYNQTVLCANATAQSVFGYEPQSNVYYATGTGIGVVTANGSGNNCVVGTQTSCGAASTCTGGAPAGTYASVYVGDSDCDATRDIVTAGAGVRIREFSETTLSTAVSTDAVIADLDGDGDGDVVASLDDGTLGRKIVWFEKLGTCSGAFSFSAAIELTPSFISNQWEDVDVADLDQDGDLDILAVNAIRATNPPSIFTGRVIWLENDGASPPSFTERSIQNYFGGGGITVDSPQGVAAGDLDGDGDEDAVFSASSNVAGSFSYLSVRENEFSFWRRNGTGAGPASDGPGSAVAGGVDVNRDGFPDQLVANECGATAVSCDNRVSLYLGTADGVETTPAWFATGGPDDFGFGGAAVNSFFENTDGVAFPGDVNHDGYQDVAIAAPRRANMNSCGFSGRTQGRVYLWYGGPADGGNPSGLGPNGTPANADVILNTPQVNVLCRGNCVPFTGGDPTVCFVNSDCAAGTCIPNTDAFGTAILGVGDRNGDGVDDFLVGDPAFYQDFCGPSPTLPDNWGRAYLYHGASTGPALAETFRPDFDEECDPGSCPCPGKQLGEHLAAGDIDGNGLSDIVVAVPGDFEWRVYLDGDRGITTTTPSQTINQSSTPVSATVADVDFDGFDDLVAAGIWGAEGYKGSASGLAASGWSYPTQVGVDAVTATASADLDGDCFKDIAVSSSVGGVSIFYGDGTAQGLSAVPVLQIEPEWNNVSAAGDVRRDGLDDLLTGDPDVTYYGDALGAAALYQGYRETGSPADCDADGVARGPDCDDGDPLNFPGNLEVCDLQDNNCDFQIDEGFFDADCDTVLDVDDNCLTWPNPGQLDSNGDGIGDECQCGDANGDGQLQFADAFQIAICAGPGGNCTADPTLADADNNGQLQNGDAFLVGNTVNPGGPPAYLLTCARRPEGTAP